MTTIIDKTKAKAERLYLVRKQVQAYEESTKETLEVLKIERDKLQNDLIEDFNKYGLTSIKVASGDSFTKAVRKGVAVKNEFAALKWASEKGAVSIDSRKVAIILKNAKEYPDCFEPVSIEYISVRKSKKEEPAGE